MANRDPRTLMERIHEKHHPQDGHLIWQGAVDKAGNPIYGKHAYQVRRVMREECEGPLPDDVLVRNTCGVRLCVKPSHTKLSAHEYDAVGRPRNLNKLTGIERVLMQVELHGDCWVTPRPQIRAGNFRSTRTISWDHYHGPIPHGYAPVPSCKNVLCVNPDHLVCVPRGKVTKAWTVTLSNTPPEFTCPKGHDVSGENSIITRDRDGLPVRRCAECRRAEDQALMDMQAIMSPREVLREKFLRMREAEREMSR